MSTTHPVLAALLLLACGAARAEPVADPQDPLTMPPCLAARAELAQARSAVLAAPGARPEAMRLAWARREAGRICLGQGAASPPGSRGPQPPVAVAPPLQGIPGAGRPSPSAPSPGLQSPARALPGPGPAAVTACDAGGCWDSQGRRLERAGPLLLGPQGACTLQGTLLNCP